MTALALRHLQAVTDPAVSCWHRLEAAYEVNADLWERRGVPAAEHDRAQDAITQARADLTATRATSKAGIVAKLKELAFLLEPDDEPEALALVWSVLADLDVAEVRL